MKRIYFILAEIAFYMSEHYSKKFNKWTFVFRHYANKVRAKENEHDGE